MAGLRISTSYNAFHLPRLAGGVGMGTAFCIWTPLIFIMQFVDSITAWLVIAIVLYGLQRAIAWFIQSDHKIFEAYTLYEQSKDSYDAGRYRNNRGFVGMTRVRGLGKDLPC